MGPERDFFFLFINYLFSSYVRFQSAAFFREHSIKVLKRKQQAGNVRKK